MQTKDFHSAIPNGLPVERLRYRDAFNALILRIVDAEDERPEFFDPFMTSNPA